MQRWKIGDVTITRIVEIEGAWDGEWILPDATPANVQRHGEWLLPHFTTPEGKLRMSVHAFVVESQGMRIVVDTCVGNDKPRNIAGWNRLQGPFLTDLSNAGFPRESIDRVICTHLHVDHVGWNTMLVNGRWRPTFPRARYWIGRTEWDHWSKAEEEDFRQPMDDSVRPVIEAGLVDLVEPGAPITAEVSLEPTPGHTPGHTSVRIRSRGEEAVITGDLMHHPIQCAEPNWASSFDSDPNAARATRRAFLERHADQPVRIFGTHFAAPTVGRIKRVETGWRFAAD
jgi:glyoxylase-like metal-dependent hydrolase (beta-lactamase superfamily II)